MRLNKRGVALLQVLIIAAVLAGLSAMILRVVMSRTLLARQTRQTVAAQMTIEQAMQRVTENWNDRLATAERNLAAAGTEEARLAAEEAFLQVAADLENCHWEVDEENPEDNYDRTYDNVGTIDERTMQVVSSFRDGGNPATARVQPEHSVEHPAHDINGRCNLRYTISNGVDNL